MANNFTGDAHCKALYRFENSSLLGDDTKSSNDLSAVGSGTVSQSTQNTSEGTYSADFDRASGLAISDANLASDHPLKLSNAGSPWTILLHWYPDVHDGLLQYLVSKYDTAGKRSFAIVFGNNSGSNFFYCNFGIDSGGSWESLIHSGTIQAGKQYGVAVTYDPETLEGRIRVWDVAASQALAADGTITLSEPMSWTDAQLILGGRSDLDNNSFADGREDEVVFLDIVLTPTQIDTYFAGTYTPDTTAPTVDSFTVGTPSGLTVPVTAFTASDAIGVTGFLITESSTPPAASAAGWVRTAPTSYTTASSGNKTLYPWAKDAAGNVSAVFASPRSVVFSASSNDFSGDSSFKALWRFESGALGADSIGTNTLTNSGASENTTTPLEGGCAARFTASESDYMSITDANLDAGFPLRSADASPVKTFSFGLRYRHLAANSVAYILSKYSVGNQARSVAILINSDSNVQANFGISGGINYEAQHHPQPLVVGNEYFIGVAFDNTSHMAKVFLFDLTNVQSYGSNEHGNFSDIAVVSEPLIIGARDNGTAAFISMDIDELVATDRYLSDVEFLDIALKTFGYAWAIEDFTLSVSLPADTTPPTVDSFTIGTPTDYTVPVTAFTASDNVRVAGYLITESSTPPQASDPDWSSSAPTSYTTATGGLKTLYPWAKDGAGNVSAVFASPRQVTFTDTTAPVVTSFTVGAVSELTVPITAFDATDSVGVEAYLVTESAVPPSAGAPGWASTYLYYTASSYGTKTLYPWAKDAAGNVSAVYGSPPVVEFADTTPPTVDSFTVGSPTEKTVPVTAFTASDNSGVTGYLITESSTPPLAGDAGWVGTAPTSYTASAYAVKTLYPWARDEAGNVSAVFGSPRTVDFSDTTAPTVDSFTVGTPSGNTAPVTAFTASDNDSVAGYLITETSTPPAAGDPGWSTTAPTEYTTGSSGLKTLYPWAKDPSGNVSSVYGTPPSVSFEDVAVPLVSSFTVGAPSDLTVQITSFTGSDDTGVTGYLITESSTQPLAGAAGWQGAAPSSYTTSSYGSKKLYPWVKDGAGNVSDLYGAAPTVTFTDDVSPTVDSFTVGTPSNLTVPVTAFTASDNVGVIGYLITESATPPLPGSPGWSSTAPTQYVSASYGTKTLYPWAKDNAGNVSVAFGAPRAVEFVDEVPPTVGTFTVGSPSGLTVPVTAFTASDNVGVTGFLITESSTPPLAGDAGWSGTAPTDYTAGSYGTKTLYPWAKDAAGNVSAAFGSPRTVNFVAPDTTPPTVDSFSVSSPYELTVSIVDFSASDDTGVTGYLITESSGAPDPGSAGWSTSSPVEYTTASAGTKTLYPWAKDAAGNVSALYGSPPTVEFATTDVAPPTVDTFTVGGAVGLTAPITAFTASDDYGVAGYLITESSTPPLPGAVGWTPSAPTDYTTQSPGLKNLYPWAKDTSGNVSAVYGSPASVNFSDITAPTVDSFTVGIPSYLTVSISTFYVSDDVGAVKFMVTESATQPIPSDPGWLTSPPSEYTTASAGSKTLYPWAMDASDNVSSVFGSPPTVNFTGAVTSSVQGTIQTLAPGELVTLFELDLTPIGISAVYRFCPSVNNGSSVVWQGEVYTPLPINATGFKASSRGKYPTPTLQVADVTGVITGLLRDNGDLLGAQVTRIRTFKKYLDGEPEADPTAEFPREVYRIERKVKQVRYMTELALSSMLDMQGKKLPGRLVLKDVCNFIYRTWNGSSFTYDTSEDACPYQGTGYFDVTGSATTAENDKCGKRLSDCKLRYPQPAVIPGRFFPGASRVRR